MRISCAEAVSGTAAIKPASKSPIRFITFPRPVVRMARILVVKLRSPDRKARQLQTGGQVR
jgi:hypothetical protein